MIIVELWRVELILPLGDVRDGASTTVIVDAGVFDSRRTIDGMLVRFRLDKRNEYLSVYYSEIVQLDLGIVPRCVDH